MFFVGDVHGKTDILINLIKRRTDGPVFQLGDMGLGFPGVALPEQPDLLFIRGNHDDPAACQKHPNYAGEFGYLPAHDLFFLSGAWSIDYGWRQAWNQAKLEEWVRYKQNSSKPPQKVWWEDEELSQPQLDAAVALYIEKKPRVVATHEAPTDAAKYLLSGGFRPEKAECANTRTSKALQQMYEAHQPDYWLFGHYHRDLEFTLVKDNEPHKTRFICLNELSVQEILTKPKEDQPS